MKFEWSRNLNSPGVCCAKETSINHDFQDSGLSNIEICPSILSQHLQQKPTINRSSRVSYNVYNHNTSEFQSCHAGQFTIFRGPGSMIPRLNTFEFYISDPFKKMSFNVIKLGKISFWPLLSEGSSQFQSSAEALAMTTLCFNFSLSPILVPSLPPRVCILKILPNKLPSGASPSQSLLPGKTNLYIFLAASNFLSFQFEMHALFLKHIYDFATYVLLSINTGL